jgi:uncharacterized cupredoxin-like copper-binding protein
MSMKWLLALATAGVLLSACGGADVERDSDDSGSMEGMDHGMASDDIDFGEPAEAAAADRTIEVTAFDSFKFKPDQIEVKQGETITFVVANVGITVHEFTLGDEDFQAAHEEEMSGEHDMEMDTDTSISIDSGEIEKLTWSFSKAGEVLYGCHRPGHYEEGMVGTIAVE